MVMDYVNGLVVVLKHYQTLLAMTNTVEGQLESMVRRYIGCIKNASTLDQALAVMKDYEGYGDVGSREEYARAILQSNSKLLS